MLERGSGEPIVSDLIVFTVLHTKIEHLAFVPPCEVGGWFELRSNRGVVQHAFESLLVRDPRRIRGYPLLRRG
jgi:hypothetical protein